MKPTRAFVLFSLLLILSSSKELPRNLGPVLADSRLVFIGKVDTVVKGKVFFSVSEPVCSGRKKYVLNCRKISAPRRMAGRDGTYLVLARHHRKNITGAVELVLEVVNDHVLITAPYVNLLLDAGWKEKLGIREQFKRDLFRGKSSSCFGVEVHVDTLVKLITEIRNTKDLSKLKAGYAEGSLGNVVLKGMD